MLLHGKIKAQQNSITFQNSWMDVTQAWSLSVDVSRQKGLPRGYYFSQGTDLHPKTTILEKKSHVSEWVSQWVSEWMRAMTRNTNTLMVPLNQMEASTGPGLHQEHSRIQQWQEPALSHSSTNFRRHAVKKPSKQHSALLGFKFSSVTFTLLTLNCQD